MDFKILSALLVVVWVTLREGVVKGTTQEKVVKHLVLGERLLTAGKMNDALSHYNAAIEGDPSKYMAYFGRARVYMGLRKSKSALLDLDKAIELNPYSTDARFLRADIKLKQGHYHEASSDYEQVLAVQPNNVIARRHLKQIYPLKQDFKKVKEMMDGGDFKGVIDVISPLIEISPHWFEIREMRAECYIAKHNYFMAINDLHVTTMLRPDNTGAFIKISSLYYEMGDIDESLNAIRGCLRLDPDHKKCFSFYKKVKQLMRQMQSAQNFINEQKWDDCVETSKQMLQTESSVFFYKLKATSHLCHCNSKARHVPEAYGACNKVLAMDKNNTKALFDRAEAHINDEMYEEAIRDLRHVKHVSCETYMYQINEGLKVAERLFNPSERKDYYKILGVKRTATKKQIIKAFRKKAQIWHPDKFPEGYEKKKAERIFHRIASAKEVLSDREMRWIADHNIDPLDPMEQVKVRYPF